MTNGKPFKSHAKKPGTVRPGQKTPFRKCTEQERDRRMVKAIVKSIQTYWHSEKPPYLGGWYIQR